jgi:hypothetical protein
MILSTMTDILFCTLDMSCVAEEETSKIIVSAIRLTIEKEIRAANGQANWYCRAVIKDMNNEDRIKIVCRDEAEQ